MAESPRAGTRVYAELKERLLEGRHRPGERLHADQLAAELDVSRQPVFDAFKRLSTEGLVTVTPHVGCHVAEYRPEEVGDYFRIFAAVEAEAASMASERRTEEQVKSLRRLHAMIGGLASLEDSDERAQGYRALNRDFHSLIHTMCGTPIVERFGSGMYDRADFFINSSGTVSPFADSITERHDDHAQIIAAIEAGDSHAASAAASAHILGTLVLIERTVDEAGNVTGS